MTINARSWWIANWSCGGAAGRAFIRTLLEGDAPIKTQLPKNGAQLDEGGQRHARLAQRHHRARAGVEHPGRQYRPGIARRVEDHDVFSPSVLAVRDLDLCSELRVPAVVHHGDFIVMGRMNGDSPSDART